MNTSVAQTARRERLRAVLAYVARSPHHSINLDTVLQYIDDGTQPIGIGATGSIALNVAGASGSDSIVGSTGSYGPVGATHGLSNTYYVPPERVAIPKIEPSFGLDFPPYNLIGLGRKPD